MEPAKRTRRASVRVMECVYCLRPLFTVGVRKGLILCKDCKPKHESKR